MRIFNCTACYNDPVNKDGVSDTSFELYHSFNHENSIRSSAGSSALKLDVKLV